MSVDRLHSQPTLEDVARLAGVSRATASRATRGSGNVSGRAQAAVDDAIRTLGYAPNRAARSLVTRRTDTITVLVPEPDTMIFTDPFFGSVIPGVSAALHDTPVQMVLLLRQPGEGLERIVRYLRSQLSDGIVLVSHHAHDSVVEELDRSPNPAVLIGRPFDPTPGLRFVDIDNRRGAEIAVEHLVERGCRRIAFVNGPPDMSASVDRAAGFQRAMRAAGLAPVATWEGPFTEQHGHEAAVRLVPRLGEIDGVFLASDLMAKGFVQEIRARGVRIPQDLRVMGFDDSPAALESVPALSTVTNPAREMAEIATRMLLQRIDGVEEQDDVILDPHLVVRATT